MAEPEPSDGVSVSDAREALAFWSERAARLPWHRRAHRREARVMVSRWRARLVRAYLERCGLGFLARALAPLLETIAHGNGRQMRRFALLALRWTPVGRWILAAATMLALASVLVLALIALLVLQLLPL